MEILIVDSGVDKTHPALKKEQWDGYTLCYNKSEKSVCKLDDFSDEIGHGTAIYDIIHRTAKSAKIKMIKIFSSELSVDEDFFCKALEYICNNETPNIINLSLGINVCADHYGLYALCKKLSDKGIILVAAFDNNGSMSFPAAFDNVIGVDTSQNRDLKTESEYEYVCDSPINIRVKGGLMRVAWKDPNYLVTGGNSFACAIVTGLVSNHIEDKQLGLHDLLNIFRANAKYIYSGTKVSKRIFDISSMRKAAVFPFNKEVHSLVRFSHLLQFDIIDVYDTRYSGKVGAKASKILDAALQRDFVIKDISNINWDEIDSIIIGHTDELAALIDILELKDHLIETALQKSKFVYSFDLTESEDVYCPRILYKLLPKNRFGKLYRQSKPVLAVLGTSSRQGKFTLQLTIRERLIRLGYKVGQLGSEPGSLLFGMDEAYPFGYNGTVELQEFDTVLMLNEMMHQIALKENDIIIAGSQSGTVPYDMGCLGQLPIKQLQFLYGVNPDAVILCINPYDEDDYIKRTICFIESSIDCRVVALCLFPMQLRAGFAAFSGAKERISNETGVHLKNRAYEIFKKPVFLLGNEIDMREVTNVVVNFFGGQYEEEYL